MNAPDRQAALAPVALCLLDGVTFAVSLDHVIAALDLGDRVSTLPCRHGALAGIFTYEDEAVPLLDLRLWLPWAKGQSERSGPSRHLVLLLTEGQRRVGIRIDALGEICSRRTQEKQLLHFTDEQDEVFSDAITLATPEGQSLGLLDVDRLLQLARIWMDSSAQARSEPAHEQAARASAAAGPALTAIALAKIDQQLVGFDTAHFVTVTTMPTIDSLAGHPDLLGYTSLHGRQIPVLSPTAIGCGSRQSDYPYLAVIAHGDCWSAIPLSTLSTVEKLDLATIQPDAEAGFPPSPISRGVVQHAVLGAAILLDAAAAVAICPIGKQLEHRAQGLTRGHDAAQRPSYLICKADKTWALEASNIERVLMPQDGIEWMQADCQSDELPIAARLRYEHATVPLYRLSRGDGGDCSPPVAYRIVVMRTEQRHWGLLVDELLYLLAPGSYESFSFPGPQGRHIEAILGNDLSRGGKKSYEVVDMRHFVNVH